MREKSPFALKYSSDSNSNFMNIQLLFTGARIVYLHNLRQNCYKMRHIVGEKYKLAAFPFDFSSMRTELKLLNTIMHGAFDRVLFVCG